MPGGPGERNGAEAAGKDATATDATPRSEPEAEASAATVATSGAGAATGTNAGTAASPAVAAVWVTALRTAHAGVVRVLSASMLVLAIALAIARSIYLNSVPQSVLPSDAAGALYDTLVRFIKEGLRVLLVLLGLIELVGGRTQVAPRVGPPGPPRPAVPT